MSSSLSCDDDSQDSSSRAPSPEHAQSEDSHSPYDEQPTKLGISSLSESPLQLLQLQLQLLLLLLSSLLIAAHELTMAEQL